MKPWRVFGFYALPVALLAALLGIFAFLGARLTGGAAPLSLPETLPAGIMVQPGAILQGQALRIGEAIANGTTPTFQRPVGSFAYTRDGTTAFMKTGTAATGWTGVAAIGGGTTGSALTSRAIALAGLGPNASCLHEDYVLQTVILYDFRGVGSGTQANETTAGAVGGWYRTFTGGTANSRSRTTAFGTTYQNIQAEPFYFAARWKVASAIDTQTKIMVGVADSVPTKGLGVGVCGSNSTTTFFYNDDWTAGPCTGVITSTGISTLTTAHLWEFWGNGTATFNVAVDGTTIATNVALTSTTTPLRAFYADVQNGTSAVDREIEVDYFHACWNDSAGP